MPRVIDGSTGLHVAVLFSGQRRTFDNASSSIARHLLCELSTQATLHLFDCTDDNGDENALAIEPYSLFARPLRPAGSG